MNPLHPLYELVAPLKPKPKPDAIKAMQSHYYEQIAKGYDQLNNTLKRDRYVEGVDRLIAAQIAQFKDMDNLVAVGSGTGRREAEIRKLSGRSYHILCIEPSVGMSAAAPTNEDLEVRRASIEDTGLPAAAFDVCTALDMFGVLAGREDRLSCLRGIHRCLSVGGQLFFDIDDVDHENNQDLKRQFVAEDMKAHGYEPGDRFFRRTDRNVVSFWHSFSRDEIEGLLSESGFVETRIWYVSGVSGEICSPGEGYILVSARKNERVGSSQ